MHDDLVTQTVDLPGGQLRLLQPREGADIPDDGPVEWAPVAPYWAILWRSGVALAREIEALRLDGLRVVELGCGLGVPSIAAGRAGASVLATDSVGEALELAQRNADANGVRIETAAVDWAEPEALVERGPFDLVLAADVLYERSSVARLLALLPRLAPKVLLAEPGRPVAKAFLEQAARNWRIRTYLSGLVRLHRMERGAQPVSR